MTTSESKRLTYVTHLPALREFLKTTNSAMSVTDYLKLLIRSKPDALLFRAKELSHQQYEDLLQELLPIADATGIELIISHHLDLAVKYGLPVQLSASECAGMRTDAKARLNGDFLKPPYISVSIHSLIEAKSAISNGTDQLVLGHLFPSRCKPGLAPRTEFDCRRILELAKSHNIPIHGIGGINFRTYPYLSKNYAGIYVMTETMEQTDIAGYTQKWRELIKTTTLK